MRPSIIDFQTLERDVNSIAEIADFGTEESW